MPELPEAETIVRGLRPALVGAEVSAVEVFHADVLRAAPDRFGQDLAGRRIESIGRRGKNVVFGMEPAGWMVVNLGMTGRLLPFEETLPADARHPAIIFRLRGTPDLVFDDTRRFGAVELLDPDEWRERRGALGPEPLGTKYSARDMEAGLRSSRTPIRSWLLDQRRIAGVGNIYASEALWSARIHPLRPAKSLDSAEVRRLHRALRRVLHRAIESGGTTLRDYRDANGKKGRFEVHLEAYGREGEPCSRCRTVVQRTVISNRSAFFCPGCQPPP